MDPIKRLGAAVVALEKAKRATAQMRLWHDATALNAALSAELRAAEEYAQALQAAVAAQAPRPPKPPAPRPHKPASP